MAVNKINGFKAPYRSLTLRNEKEPIIAKKGLLSIDDDITQAGSTITVPPFVFNQNGMIVEVTDERDFSSPTIEAPYYLTVSAPTPNDLDDLIFTFAKSPTDITTEQVIVGEYDGLEWRLRPFLTIGDTLQRMDDANLDFNRVGPAEGLTTSVDGSEYRTEAGVIVDSQGFRQRLNEARLFSIVDPDPDWDRVDHIVYRRPLDSQDRIGTRKFITGGTFAAAPSSILNTAAFDTTLPRLNTRVLIGSDNTAHLLVASGYTGVFDIIYAKYSSDRTTQLVAPISVATGTTPNFDAVIDGNDDIHIVYTNGLKIQYEKIDDTGSSVASNTTFDNLGTQSANATVAVDQGDNKVFIIFQSLLGVSNNQIYMAVLDIGGTLATSPLNIEPSASNYINPSVFVDADLIVHIAWEDLTLTKIFYKTVNDIGTEVDSILEVSGDTEQIGVGTLADNAKNPRVWVTDNNTIFVTFLQLRSGAYGFAVWEDGEATMSEIIGPTEDFQSYDLYIDDYLNEVHVLLERVSSLDYVKLEGIAVRYNLQVAATAVSGVATVKDKLGSMLHFWSDDLETGFTLYEDDADIAHIGPISVVGGLNTIPLTADAMLVTFGSVDPRPGDRVTIANSGSGNDGLKTIVSVTTVSLNAVDDHRLIVVDSDFNSVESPATGVTGDYEAPDGNFSRFVKSTSETSAFAYRFDTLDSDVQLARIVQPGQIILNWVDTNIVPNAGSDFFLVYGMSVCIDWEQTTPGNLTITNDLKILDLLRNHTYSVANGGFPMQEDDALYVVLDGANFNVTPQVTEIANLPFGDPIRVLGVIKEGEFNPHLLGTGGVGQLDSGEANTIGEALPKAHRQKLGLTTETSVEPLRSTRFIRDRDTYPTRDSALDCALAGMHAVFQEFMSTGPIREIWPPVSGGPQSIFDALTIRWHPDNSVTDIMIFGNDGLLAQDSPYDVVKNSSTQLAISPPVPDDFILTVWVINPAGVPRPYYQVWQDGVTGFDTDTDITGGGEYNIGRKTLDVYRNGKLSINSASYGKPIDNYCESGPSAVSHAVALVADDNVALVNHVRTPIYKFPLEDLTGTTVDIPTYTPGDGRLMVVRNGLLLNAAGAGQPIDQVTESSPTQITVGVALTAGENGDHLILMQLALVPTWREVITGVTGTSLVFSSSYDINVRRLLLFKNGQLLCDEPSEVTFTNDTYTKSTAFTVTLGLASVATDVWEAIYLADEE